MLPTFVCMTLCLGFGVFSRYFGFCLLWRLCIGFGVYARYFGLLSGLGFGLFARGLQLLSAMTLELGFGSFAWWLLWHLGLGFGLIQPLTPQPQPQFSRLLRQERNATEDSQIIWLIKCEYTATQSLHMREKCSQRQQSNRILGKNAMCISSWTDTRFMLKK
jgi:hypothetical protein